MTRKAIVEEADHCLIVGLLFEFERPAQLHILFELVRLTFTQSSQVNFYLLLFNGRVFLVFRATGKSLPRQRPFEEVEEHVSDGF